MFITGPREGVTQQRVPAGHLRPAGRKPRGWQPPSPGGRTAWCTFSWPRDPAAAPGSGMPFCGEESRGRVWSCAARAGGSPPAWGVPLAQDLCLWPLTRGFLPVPPLCQVLSQMWWVLPGRIRQGTGLTHCAISWGGGGRWAGRSHPAWGHPGGRDGAVESEKRGVSLTRRDPTGRKGTQGSKGTPRTLIFVLKAVGTMEIFEQGRFRVRVVTKRSPWFLCVGRIRGGWEPRG